VLQWLLVDVQQQWQRVQWWQQANTEANTDANTFAFSFSFAIWLVCN
jgi:hypothetical protein